MESFMLEIAQAGHAGKTGLLFDMHRLRKRVFKDRMGWPVHVTPGGLEVDDFDLPEAVYLLALDDERRVIGNWRMLAATGPTMIRDVWPQFLGSIDMPHDPHVWEASRFAVDSLKGNSEEGIAQNSMAMQELFCGAAELSLLCGIREIFAMYDMRIARMLQRLDCQPRALSAEVLIEGDVCRVGAFTTDEIMLSRLRAATGLTGNLLTPDMLPPLLHDYYLRKNEPDALRSKRDLELVE